MSHPIAAIDLGTNSARLLIAATDPFRQLHLIRQITRLGGGFTREFGLSAEAQERSLQTLRRFAAEMAAHGVKKVRGVATSAVRDAANGAAFCERVAAETGISLEVIDGTEEALLTLKGVCSVVECSGDLFVFDLGGGSTEYTLSRGGVPIFSRSLPVGVVRLTEGKEGSAQMLEKVSRELAGLRSELEREGVLEAATSATLVGTAGTPTTLAAIQIGMTDYDYRRLNNFVLGIGDVEAIYERLLPLTPQERLQVPGLEPGREDLVVAGLLVVLETMRSFGFPSLTVSDYGLLEGLILSM
ncbi:exopolyphosphatase [Geomonas sp. RF6]|uniref:Ppx/GppA phosphatase family protein n=1 Tax=Geomonas sp. RF6 TaxID=2897342 RepID=UPI001E349D41|nr:exopolyphosphatase [Geomonas sp. RF6]UFS70042.1 exopolyphosphatase [Geomonas sp. RF6]